MELTLEDLLYPALDILSDKVTIWLMLIIIIIYMIYVVSGAEEKRRLDRYKKMQANLAYEEKIRELSKQHKDKNYAEGHENKKAITPPKNTIIIREKDKTNIILIIIIVCLVAYIILDKIYF